MQRIPARPISAARARCLLTLAVSVSCCAAPATAAAQLQQDVQRAIARAENSVVAIARVRKGAQLAPSDPNFVPSEYASGVVVDRRGLILTSYHVLGDVEQHDYWVWTRGRPFRVLKVEQPQAADPWLDLALLKVGAEDLQPIPLGDAAKLAKGQFVVALGNPYAIARDGEASASLGIVSNLNRKAPPVPGQESRETLHQLGTLIQTDARLPLGCSGGALVNLQGEMVGLTISMAALAGEETEAGFAIPVDATFRRGLDNLKAGRINEYGYLGVLPLPLPLAERRRGRPGVLVQNVFPATPASASRLRRMDVIRAVDDQLVRDPAELVRLVSSRAAGDEVELTLERGEDEPAVLKRNVQLTKKRPTGPLPPIGAQPPRQWRGAQVEYVTAMPDFPFHSYKVDPQGCVGLLEVATDSPLWRAGFRQGDYISHIDGRRVSTPEEFFQAVAGNRDPVRARRPASQGRPAEDVMVAP